MLQRSADWVSVPAEVLRGTLSIGAVSAVSVNVRVDVPVKLLEVTH
jgi:hypothetical protein